MPITVSMERPSLDDAGQNVGQAFSLTYMKSPPSTGPLGREPGINEAGWLGRPIAGRGLTDQGAEGGKRAALGDGESRDGLGELGEDFSRCRRPTGAVQQDREQVEVREGSRVTLDLKLPRQGQVQ
jgi:hypothetical protein